MYLRPDDIRFMTAAGLTPTRHMTSPSTPTSEAVLQARKRRRHPYVRRLLGTLLLKTGTALLRSAHRGQQQAFCGARQACDQTATSGTRTFAGSQ